jgi:hypothetical protein
MITHQAKRLKNTAIATGVPKAFVRVRTKIKRIKMDDGRYISEFHDAWGHLTCRMEDMDKYATKMESFPEDLVVTRHYSESDLYMGRLIAVHFTEKINK